MRDVCIQPILCQLPCYVLSGNCAGCNGQGQPSVVGPESARDAEERVSLRMHASTELRCFVSTSTLVRAAGGTHAHTPEYR